MIIMNMYIFLPLTDYNKKKKVGNISCFKKKCIGIKEWFIKFDIKKTKFVFPCH